MCIDEVDEFTLTQPIVGVTERSVTERSVTERSVIQTLKVIKQVNVITQKKAKRNVHNKQSRCSNTLNWIGLKLKRVLSTEN